MDKSMNFETMEAASSASSTQPAAKPAATKRKRRHRAVDYPVLTSWPSLSLGQPTGVYLEVPVNPSWNGLRVPVKLLRKCGLKPENGVSVSVQGDRVLLRALRTGYLIYQKEESKQFELPRAGLSAGVMGDHLGIVMGEGYLVLTSSEDAIRLAGDAPRLGTDAFDWQRVDGSSVPVLDESIDPAGLEVLGWKDVQLRPSNRARQNSRVANVSGHLWWQAGFKAGTLVKFTRYRNGTMVEEAAPGDNHSVVATSTRYIPRHFFGVSLMDVGTAPAIRVIATKGKLIVTRLDSDLAQACDTGTHQRLRPTELKPLYEKPAKIWPEFDTEGLTVRAWKDFAIRNGSILIGSQFCALAGITLPIAVEMTTFNGVVDVRASTDTKAKVRGDERINVGLTRAGMGKESKVRVFVCEGRLLVTKIDGPLDAFSTEENRKILKKDLVPKRVPRVKTPKPLVRKLTPKTKLRRRRRVRDAQGPFLVEGLNILTWRDYQVRDQRVGLRGAIWSVAGFTHQHPARLHYFDNAVSIDECDEKVKTITIGTESTERLYRDVPLARTVLEDEQVIRAVFTAGRVILTALNSPLAKLCEPAKQWPEQRGRRLAPVVAALKYEKKLPLAV